MSTTKVCIECGAVYDIGQKFCPNDGSPLRMQNAEDPLIGQVVADRYQIISLIGEGGMGRVYCAEHVRMGRKSAVKVINPALATTADAISRFNREAANACRINHPNVAQVYDFGEMADDTLYLAMEYVDGETLDTVIARSGPLAVMRAAQITKQVADALFAAHHLDIVHRDLKPENVMLARHLDGSDWVKVVDFGIAKTVQRDGGGGSQTVTTAGVSLGTPEYMSPEQLAGERLDHRTDIYSLGLVLFNMLTGELPYPKVTSKETLVRRLTSKPRTLAEVRPATAWPSGLQEALDRALATEVADRYDSVAAFGRDVVAAAANAPPAVTSASDARVALSAATLVPPSTPRAVGADAPDDAAIERPMAHRRALPWAVATASLLVAVAVFAASRTRRAERLGMFGDTVGHPVTDPTLIFTDSLSRATRGLEQQRFVNVDSILAQIGPEIERAGRMARQNARASIPNRHFWLRARGDSVAARPLPRSAPIDVRIAAAGEEIRAHIARMRRFFDSGDARAARLELNSASSELEILRELAPQSPVPAQLDEALAHGMRDLVISCYRKQADSTLGRGIRCDNLVGAPSARTRGLRRPEAVPR